jgi:hypothetical protein
LPILGDAETVKNRTATAQAAVPYPAIPYCQWDLASRIVVPSNHVGTFPASTMSAAGGQREIKSQGELRQYFAIESQARGLAVAEVSGHQAWS